MAAVVFVLIVGIWAVISGALLVYAAFSSNWTMAAGGLRWQASRPSFSAFCCSSLRSSARWC
ncbi:hypothetical protein [Methyloceanibacter stevinii]|uniref:hypothetical protein n=1 Tax=Methyloceanibacter stevinii TaxID=1774970 RepID=UPI0031397D6C